MKAPKICLICSLHHPGIKTHFWHLSKNINASLFFVENLYHPIFLKLAKFLKIPLPSILSLKEYDIIILGGWRASYLSIIKNLKKENKKVGIYWTSSIGQSEMTEKHVEIYHLNHILNLLKEDVIDFIMVPERTYEAMGKLKKVFLLPYTFNFSQIKFSERKNIVKRTDIFLSVRHGKNILTQFIGVHLADPDIEIYTNIKNKEFLNFLQLLEIPFRYIEWIPNYEEYLKFISKMGFSLQITYTETFNYAVAERMAMGIPVFASGNIFLITQDEFLKKYLYVEAPDSPLEISKKIRFLLKNSTLYHEINIHIRKFLEKFLKSKEEKFQECFSKFLKFIQNSLL